MSSNLTINNNQSIGAVIGETTSHDLEFIVDVDQNEIRPVEVGEYVGISYGNNRYAIGLVTEITRVNNEIISSFANSPSSVSRMNELSMYPGSQRIVASVSVQGILNENGQLIRPRYPPAPGAEVIRDPTEILDVVFAGGGVKVGNLVANPEVEVSLDINKLISRHFSVLAVTGAGKSYTVSVILDEIMKNMPFASIVILDPHQDYFYLRENTEYGNKVQIFTPSGDGNSSRIKFKISNFDNTKIMDIIGLRENASRQRSFLSNVLTEMRNANENWDLSDVREEINTQLNNPEISAQTKSLGYSVLNYLNWVVGEDFLDALVETPLTSPNEPCLTKKGQMTIIGTGLLDNRAKGFLVEEVLKKIFTGAVNYRRGTNPENALEGPILVILEEAHQFIPGFNEKSSCRGIIKQIAGEGRKFGVGLGIISQRPGKVDENVLSQCNTQITLKITNPKDQNAIGSASESITQDLLNDLPGLNTGEAIINGSAITSPAFVKIRQLDLTPGGDDIDIESEWVTPNENEDVVTSSVDPEPDYEGMV